MKVPVSEKEGMSEATSDGNQSHVSTLYEDVLAMPVTLWTWWLVFKAKIKCWGGEISKNYTCPRTTI
ncbi:hypothetical protein DPMN_098627 [Dreissena polymorpha]|uniref:Uncharacterized protein n=1 Tax=Dreissena polymorpha TaxID=45954 RepID=A0A9D4LF23_DREPO|nr:hypothetical protein DPMN_098627 [Dreissena polymorpha]